MTALRVKAPKLLAYALLGLFILLPAAGILSTPDNAEIKSEKRTAAPFPTALNRSFLSGFGAYVKDRLLLRIPVMDLLYPFYMRNFRSFDLIYTTPIRGSNGFWFIGNNYEHVFFQHALNLNPDYFAAPIAQFVQQRLDLAKQTGIPFKMMIVPDKHGIYPELLPPYHEPGRYRFANYFLQYARAKGLDIYDAYPDMRAARNDAILYYRQDSHWNLVGAYVGYSGMMRHLGLTPIQVSFNPLPGPREGGDLVYCDVGTFEPADNYSVMSYRPINASFYTLTPRTDPKAISGLQVIKDARLTHTVFENDSAPYPQTILLIGDSTSDSILPYYYASFKRVIAADATFDPFSTYVELAKLFKPDLIIFQVVERQAGIGANYHRPSTP